MPKIARLSDVNPQAVSLVRKGANRQTFFLRKSDGSVLDAPAEGATALLEAPTVEDAVFAKADWSAVYCVVAAPGARENPGILAKADDPDDEWASEDEIRKAAHAFMKNGGLINKMHEDLSPFGQVVENAIALADLEIDGHTIAKGSWYLAIEPTVEGRDAIEKGEFTGVSLQGTGVRTIVEVEKASSAPAAQGSKGKDREGKGTSQLCPSCKSKVKLGAKTCQNCGAKLSGSTGKGKLAKAVEAIGLALGIDVDVDEDEDVELAKATTTFGVRMAAREVEDDLPMALDVLRASMYDSIYPFVYGYEDAPTPAEARTTLDTSLGEFHTYLLAVFDRVAGADIAKGSPELQAQMRTLKENLPEGMTTTTEDVNDMADPTKIEALETQVATLQKSVEDLVTGLAPVIEKVKEQNEPAPTVEDVQKSIAELAKGLDDAVEKIEKLGAGSSSQPQTVAKTDSTADPLAGLLS